MREKRAKVVKAAINLVRASNPNDEVFVVNFSDEYFLDQPFTSKINLLQNALEKYETRGGTALYDAVVASADELKKHGKLQKKILFVVTDGEDDASRESLEQAVRRLQEENGPTVYAIGLLGEERQRRAKRALETIAERTGGIAFFPARWMKWTPSAAPLPATSATSTPSAISPPLPGAWADIAPSGWTPAPRTRQAHRKDPQRLLCRPGASRRRRKLTKLSADQLTQLLTSAPRS